MNNIYQKTLSKSVIFEGIGLHTGKNSIVNLNPADEDTGIIFKRTDLSEKNLIHANFTNVTSAKLCTTLENRHGVKVSTVEHLLMTLYIAGVDNAIIEINNEEVPIMDGSAKDFLNVIKKIDLVDQSKTRKYLKILNKIELIDGTRRIYIEPNERSLEVEFQLNYENKIIGQQKNIINFQKDNLDDVSSSRTFCLFEDIEKIKKFGLAKGGSLDNAVVVKNEKVLNEGGLRNNKEFVNHKILDLVGDFLLSGHRIFGKVVCYQGGHELSNIFLKKIFKSQNSFAIIENKKVNIADNTVNSFKSEKIAVNA